MIIFFWVGCLGLNATGWILYFAGARTWLPTGALFIAGIVCGLLMFFSAWLEEEL